MWKPSSGFFFFHEVLFFSLRAFQVKKFCEKKTMSGIVPVDHEIMAVLY